MDYKEIQGRLADMLRELSDISELVWGAQRATIGTHRSELLCHLGRTGESLDSAFDDVTLARLNLLRAEQADGGAE